MLTTEWGNVRYPSCRDKGWMWGGVGALCLSWWQRDPWGTSWSKKVAPQRGQAQGPLNHSTLPLVPTGLWAASVPMGMMTPFGWQHSVGVGAVWSGVGTISPHKYRTHDVSGPFRAMLLLKEQLAHGIRAFRGTLHETIWKRCPVYTQSVPGCRTEVSRNEKEC